MTWRVERHDSLPSTSDACIARANAGEPDGLVVLARRQTSPRGSRGRPWVEPDGNLCISVLLRPGGMAAQGGVWALLAGIALHETLVSFLPDASALRLKWPNDLLLHGRKLAGILIDTAAGPAGLDWLVIGCGANLAAAPSLPDRMAAALAEAVPAPAPETVAMRFLGRLAAWRERLAQAGFEPVRAAWLARAHPLGAPLRLRLPTGDAAGAFAGLSPDGALLLATGEGVRAYATGEVLLGRA